MAEIRPFQGIHYNKSLSRDLSAVICPPYDIINPQQQLELCSSSEYNFIRLEFNQELPQDTPTDNKYTRAALTFEQWLNQGILETDKKPAIYLYDQYFKYREKQYKRRSMIARVRLEEWEKGVVRPHESTASEPKADRLSLLRASKANTSPILAIYQDQSGQIGKLLAAAEKGKPLLGSEAKDGEGHTVRAITEPKIVKQISELMAGQSIYIADGHHRYESALAYRNEISARLPSVTGEEPFNFAMITLVDFTDPGLLILPTHRLVRGITKSAMEELMPKLKLLFEVDSLPLSAPDLWQKIDQLYEEADVNTLVLFGLSQNNLSLLKIRDRNAINQMMPLFHSELYKKLDVSIIDHVILEKLLGVILGKENPLLAYEHDRENAIKRVIDQEYQLTFLTRPVKPETIKAISDVGDRMPRKSTYFYPKLPSGLIVYRLE